jgi:hypothetical protein
MLIHLFRGRERIFGFTAEADGSDVPGDYGLGPVSNQWKWRRGSRSRGLT